MWGLGALADIGADLSLAEAISNVAPYDGSVFGYGGDLSKLMQEIYSFGYVAANTDSGALSDAELASLVRNSSSVSAGNKKSLINNLSLLRQNNFFVHKAGPVSSDTIVAKVTDPAKGRKPVEKKLDFSSALDLVFSAAKGSAMALSPQTAQAAAKKIMDKQARGETVYQSGINPVTVVWIVGGVAVLGLVGYTIFAARQGRK